ncbi:MAG: hypothetical protein H6719_07110 [Sandaracinaceae bacterium]|nr:hypothetical protein [Sandaracinaceae bacterium]
MRSVAAAVLVLASLAPGVARAELFYLAADARGLVCLPVGDLDCATATCEDACGPIGTGSGCHHADHTLLCCDTDSDCRLTLSTGVSVSGQCDLVTGLQLGPAMTVFGACTFTDPPEAMLCGRTTAESLAPCVPASGNDWRDGDCDGDGLANGVDPAPCRATEPSDAGVPGNDAGTRDAGASDAGADDAGEPLDAAAPSDAGPSRSLAPRFGGGGGCVCGFAPPRSGEAWVLALALAWLARRRAR